MKTRVMLSLVAVLVLAVAGAACSGGGGGGGDDDDDDDGGTAGPGELALVIDAAPHANQEALFRMKVQGGGAPPIACSTVTLDGAGQGTLVLTSGMLVDATA